MIGGIVMEKKIRDELIAEYYNFTVKIIGGLLLFKLIIFVLVVSKNPDQFASLAAGFLPSFPLTTFLMLILMYLALLGNKKQENKLIYWRAKVKALMFTIVYYLFFISAYEELLNQAINGSQNHGLMKLIMVPNNVIYYLSQHLGEVTMHALRWGWIVSAALLIGSFIRSLDAKNRLVVVILMIVFTLISGIYYIQTWAATYMMMNAGGSYGSANQVVRALFFIVSAIINLRISYSLEKPNQK